MAFSMEIPNEKELAIQVMEEVKPVSQETEKLRAQAEQNAQEIMNLDLNSLTEKNKLTVSIDSFGMDSIGKSSSKNSLLKVTVGKLSQEGQEGSQVSKSLADLKTEIKDLDPSAIDFAKGGVLGKIVNPIRRYFDRYEKSEEVIADIVESLEKGKATLKNDNTTLAIEEQDLSEITKKISKEIEMGMLMDECISAKIEEARAAGMDADKIRFIEEEILFPLRQRVMDMQQMVVVNQQGIVAMEIIQRNNKELMRGVDRAKNITVSALRTAVMVASALYDQKIVLKKIEALNATTDNLISSTSKMLKEQGSQIQQQSMSTGVSIDTLKVSFSDLMEALDSISEYKRQALPQMQQTITAFREMAEQGEIQVKKLEKGSAIAALSE